MRPTSLTSLLAVTAFLLAACSRSPPSPVGAASSPEVAGAPTVVDPGPRPALATVRIEGVPHTRQRPDFCGEACLEMAAARLGSKLDQDDAFLLAGVDPGLGRGAHTAELARAAQRMGFRIGEVWSEVSARDPGPGLASLFASMHADLARGVPSIVCMRWGDDPQPEHFRLVVGYDAVEDEVVYQEPAEDAGGYRTMPRSTFLSRWPLRYGSERWSVVRIALDPRPEGLAARPERPPGPSLADLSQHVQALRPRLPPGFHVVVERPFVVVGNGGAAEVASVAQGTVRFAVERLERDFFRAAPERVLEVWLFADADSYRAGVLRLTGEAPDTPYGFYSSRRGGLFMNIATGGGTLVHEIVHPYVEADLPEAPSWVNEGLGSLFEQSGDRAGLIVGLPNWRLAGLQEAIREDRLPSFHALAHTSTEAFYEDRSGTSYAQARYLMLWLQERGALIPFVHALRSSLRRDPTGWATLTTILGEKDMEAFQERWETWVMGLRFP
jgi:hypothetical protein